MQQIVFVQLLMYIFQVCFTLFCLGGYQKYASGAISIQNWVNTTYRKCGIKTSSRSFFNFQRIFCKKNSENVSMLIETNSDSFVYSWKYKRNMKITKKSLVICATQLAGSVLLKILKYFKVMLNIFEFSYVKEIVES